MVAHIKEHADLKLRRSGAFSNSKLGKHQRSLSFSEEGGAIAQAAASLGAKQKWRLLAPPPSLRSPSFPPLPVHPADSGTITATAAKICFYPTRSVWTVKSRKTSLGRFDFVVLERRRSGVVAMASVGQKVYAPGVAVSEGNGGLQKIDLKSPHGRYFFFSFLLLSGNHINRSIRVSNLYGIRDCVLLV